MAGPKSNLAMHRKLAEGDALDVRTEGTKVEPGLFELRRFVEDKDYCDPLNDAWIWSIGRSTKTGKILASTTSRLYGAADFDCLFLR